ncbi:hypothetical protein SBA1_250018 [Candidatus Sulfotelmatobacter kueseliae]|uniref:Uncharacterized protein n=1 Tax=Candidatus Sulfotelmatobacter kueseliae TaxID=2042962 RepID=A0A2U3KHN7_9BACT|nr:hypothetical protein SBA1_250018 [Candidatus Sulfotelmatobacter kueseliae]
MEKLDAWEWFKAVDLGTVVKLEFRMQRLKAR